MKKKYLSKKEKWKIARPYLVKVVLLITDYIFNMDEEMKNV